MNGCSPPRWWRAFSFPVNGFRSITVIREMAPSPPPRFENATLATARNPISSELTQHRGGNTIIRNFLVEIARCTTSWDLAPIEDKSRRAPCPRSRQKGDRGPSARSTRPGRRPVVGSRRRSLTRIFVDTARRFRKIKQCSDGPAFPKARHARRRHRRTPALSTTSSPAWNIRNRSGRISARSHRPPSRRKRRDRPGRSCLVQGTQIRTWTSPCPSKDPQP